MREFRLKLYPQNFEQTKSFYRETLGFPIVTEWNIADDDKGVMFTVGSSILELLPHKNTSNQIQGVGVSIEVDDVFAFRKILGDKVNTVYEPRHNSWGNSSFSIIDPEGLEITFFTQDMWYYLQ